MTPCPTPMAECNATGHPKILYKYNSELNVALRQTLSNSTLELYSMLRYYMGWVDSKDSPKISTQGKALRPTLCLLSCEAFGGSVDSAMPAAVALELIHNFSLIHDDIQDLDEVRHHRPTLWAIWGVPKAMIAGNALRVIADTCLEKLVAQGIGTDKILKIIDLLTEAYLEMIEGQYMDLLYEGRHDISMNDYMSMIAKKTGALIRCAVDMGTTLAINDQETLEKMHNFGSHLGYAFQIRDDYLGVWGREAQTGKSVGGDIRRKKNSFPIVYAMSMSTGRDRKALNDAYRKQELSSQDIQTVLKVMEKLNVPTAANALAAEQCQAALATLETARVESSVKNEMEDLVKFLMTREY